MFFCYPQTLNKYILALILFLSILLPNHSSADEPLSKEAVVQIIQAQYGGQVLKVKRKNGVYKVKVLTESGRVKQVYVDENDGAIINKSPKK